MTSYVTPRELAWAAAIVLGMLVAGAAVIHDRRGEETVVLRPMEPGTSDPLVSELARCRTIAPDDPGLLESCRQIWAENRQRFFLSTKSPQLPATSAPSVRAAPVKGQDPVPPHGVDEGRAAR